MTRIFSFIALCLVGLSQQADAQKDPAKMDSLSYSVGVLVGQNLKRSGLDEVNTTDLASGLSDAIKGGNLKISPEKANQILETYMNAQQAKESAGIIEEGKAFLEQNGKRQGVVTLPSGLQYEILKEGNGPKPKATDKVTTHYHGTLIDGTVFDSSVERGQPATFPVNGVIQGWVEALQLMPVGSKWKLFVPYNLAYGERGAGQTIQPYATLIFEVELLSIN